MTEIRTSYDAAADAWRAGPARMYARMAEAMAARTPFEVDGARVLDAGAGTGVAGDAMRRRGAGMVVAVDLADGMLPRSPALSTVGDLTRLPFAAGAFDLGVAAFSLNHFTDPVPPTAELRRVAHAMVATTYAPEWAHPAKDAVDEVLERHGFEPPEWYTVARASANPGPDDLAGCATLAGFDEVAAEVVDVDTGMDTARDLVDWRLGMAHIAPYVAALPADDRVRLRGNAEAAVAGMPPLVVAMVLLTAR